MGTRASTGDKMYSGRDDDQELLAPSEEATSMQRPGLKVILPGGGEVGRRRQVRDFIMIIDILLHGDV